MRRRGRGQRMEREREKRKKHLSQRIKKTMKTMSDKNIERGCIERWQKIMRRTRKNLH